MAGPSVIATIEGRDLFTAVLEKTLRDAKGKSAAFAAEQERHARLATDAHARNAERMRMLYDGANAAMMGLATKYGAHTIHSVMEVGKTMENEQRKILSFSDTTVAQMERVRRAVDTTYSTIQGGPEAALEAVRAGVLSGIKAENVVAALPVINLHSVETGTSTEHGTESLVGLANMLGTFHNDASKIVTAADATQKQFVEGMRAAENVAITANKVAPGSLQSQVDAIRVAYPVAHGLNISLADMMAANATMMSAGYGGAAAGQYIKSAMARSAQPTAAMRSAVASYGMHMSDYQTVDAGHLTDESVQAGLSQALGTLTDKFKSRLHTSLERFRSTGDQETFHTQLVDLIRTDGGKKSPVQAANVAERVLTPAVTGFDFAKFVTDYASHGGTTAGLAQMFGKEVGGALAPLLGPQFAAFRDKFRAELPKDSTTHAIEENADSYTAKVDGLQNAVKGLQDQLFVGLKPAIETAVPPVTDLVKGLAGLPSPVHEVMGAVLTGGTAIAGLKTAGTLANLVGGLEKFALGAEKASPIIRVLGGLAAIEFGPAVAGVALLTAGIEAFVHRAEIAHALDLHNRDDFDRPDTAEQAADLRAKRDADMATIADRQRNAARDELAHDPILDDLNARRLSLLADLGVQYGDTPALRAARQAKAAADRDYAKPDPGVVKAGAELRTVQEALAKRDEVQSRDIAALHRYLDQHQRADPNAGDADLDRMKDRRATLRSSLPTPDATTPELDVLNARIEHRETFNREQLDARLRAAERLLEDAKDAAGAPKVGPADLDAAKTRYEAAQQAAIARRAQAEQDADAAIARAKADAEAAIKARPEVVQLQRQIDDRTDYVRAHLPEDDEVTRLRREVANANRALERYEHEVVTPERTAFDQTHPTFTRPENVPTAPAAKGRGAPAFRPDMDYVHPTVPRAGLTAFGLNGPQADVSGIVPQLRAMLYPTARAEGPHEVQKVDVAATVTGTVTGKGEVTGKLEASVQPSRYLETIIRRAELAGRMDLDGAIGGDTTMGGVNGVVQHPERRGLPAGIGHR